MSAGEEGGAAASAIAVAARPRVSLERARAIARDVFGLDGSVSELGSNQDRNFRVDSPEGQFVLKIANESWHRDALAAQTAALERVAAATAKAGGSTTAATLLMYDLLSSTRSEGKGGEETGDLGR